MINTQMLFVSFMLVVWIRLKVYRLMMSVLTFMTDDADHGTGNDNTDDYTDDGGRGNLYIIQLLGCFSVISKSGFSIMLGFLFRFERY